MVKRTKIYSSDDEDKFGLGHDDSDLVDFIEEHEEHIPIDEHALEECLKQQTVSYYAVSKRLAEETSKRDAVKTLLREVEARVDVDLRKEARDTSSKTTETELASKRQIHPDVVKTNKMLLRFQHRVRMLEALDKEFSQRAYVLRDLGQLWIASYYSETGGDSSGRAVRDTRAQTNKKEMSKLRNQRG